MVKGYRDSHKEIAREYRDSHKEQSKAWREINSEYIKNQRKINKDIISQKSKERVNCEKCSKEINQGSLYTHRKFCKVVRK